MDRRSLIAYTSVIAMLGATVVALTFGVDVTLQDQPGIRMRMPAQVADWKGQQQFYCHNESCQWYGAEDQSTNRLCPRCGHETFTMARAEKEQLPADTEFLKYVYSRPNGEELRVSIVLSGSARNSIHRPQRCLAAQGYDITQSHVVGLPIPGREPLQAMVLDTQYRFQSRGQPVHTQPVSYAYWFAGQNRETPFHLQRMFWLAWDRIFHGVAHRWVYIMMHGKAHQSSEAFTRSLQDFIPGWYPSVLL